MNLVSILVSAALLMPSVMPFGPDFDTTATQEVTGTLSTSLALSVSSTGRTGNLDMADGADCGEFWNDTSGAAGFTRGKAAVSTCTRLTFTTGDPDGANITVAAAGDNYCGFMYVDANTDGNIDANEVLLKNSGDAADVDNTDTGGNCDDAGDVVAETTTTGSSLHLRSQALDISEDQDTGAAGVDCTDTGVYTSDYSDGSTSDQSTTTAGSLASDYLAVTRTAGEILNCTDAMISASFYVEFKVYVPSTAPDGAYEMNLTYTIANN